MVCEKDKMSPISQKHYKFIRDQFLSLLAGTLMGLIILCVLILPYDWKPMGRWGTYYIFSILLGSVHVAIWISILLPFTLWIESRHIEKSLFHVLVSGALLYGVIALLIQLCFDHLGLDSVWFLCLALPVGGSTALTYALLHRRGKAIESEPHEPPPCPL